MYFFCTQMIDAKASGIEHAMMKRLMVFKAHHQDALILTRDYNREYHRNLAINGLTSAQTLNMFDYFQGAVDDVTGPVVLPVDLTIPKDAVLINRGDRHLYCLGATVRMKLTFFDQAQHRLDTVTYYDQFGHAVQRDRYDVRGFLSLRETMGVDGQVANEVMFSPTGKVVYRSYYRHNLVGQVVNSLLQLVDYRGNDYYFDNLDQLLRFFFDEINLNAQGDNVFIADRSYIVEQALIDMVTPRKVLCYAHNVLTTVPDRPLASPLYDSVKVELASPKTDGMILQTQAQADDLKRVSQNQKSTMVVPSAVISRAVIDQPNRPIKQRQRHHLMTVARIHEQKHLEDTLLAFAIIKHQIPDATLSIYGYVNDPTLFKKLKQLVTTQRLTKAVKFCDYQPDLVPAYQDAVLYLATPRYEGYGLAMVDALAYGVPVLSYAIKYGPSDIIIDGENGFLIQPNDYRAMARKAVHLLQNTAVLQEFSNKAKSSAARYSVANNWQAWEDGFQKCLSAPHGSSKQSR